MALISPDFIDAYLPPTGGRVAVAVSGGADSMALLHAAAQVALDRGGALHVLTVDHGLRPESAGEAGLVARYCANLPLEVTHKILSWQHNSKPRSRLQEEARKARYQLMAEYCMDHQIHHLLTAHHQDDQAETFLMRLCAGSGLNGLAAMGEQSPLSQDIDLLRPFLSLPKDDLLAYCAQHDIPYVNDPSNKNDRFARVRLREAEGILAREGLTAKRLSVTAGRMRRAADALDCYTDQFWVQHVALAPSAIKIPAAAFDAAPSEIALRLVMRIIAELGADKNYPPRMEKMENLARDMQAHNQMKRRTLGGAVFEKKISPAEIIAVPE